MGLLKVFTSGGLVPFLSDKASKKASQRAVDAITQASDKNIALARETRDMTRADFAPGREAYGTGIDALYDELGLTRPSAAAAPGGGVNKTAGGPAGTSPLAPGATGGGFDAAAYLAANPDVADYAKRAAEAGIDKTPEQIAQEHYEQFGKAEGRQAPMTPIDRSGENYGAGPEPEAFNPQDYTRPEQPQWEDPGAAPAFAFDFKADPGYEWRQQEAARGGNAAFGAKGLLRSGGAIKAAQDRSYNLADQSYNTAYDQYMRRLEGDRAQFNTDRSAKFNIFDSTRRFDEANADDTRDFEYGAGRDERGDFEADRGFGAGREDQRISNLFGVTSLGQNAVAGTATAGNVFTSAATAANNNVGEARANKAIADYDNSFWNQAIGGISKAAGKYLSGGI